MTPFTAWFIVQTEAGPEFAKAEAAANFALWKDQSGATDIVIVEDLAYQVPEGSRCSLKVNYRCWGEEDQKREQENVPEVVEPQLDSRVTDTGNGLELDMGYTAPPKRPVEAVSVGTVYIGGDQVLQEELERYKHNQRFLLETLKNHEPKIPYVDKDETVLHAIAHTVHWLDKLYKERHKLIDSLDSRYAAITGWIDDYPGVLGELKTKVLANKEFIESIRHEDGLHDLRSK